MRTQVPRLTVRRLIMSQADAPINGGANHKPWRRESQTFAHCGLHVAGIQTYQLPDHRHPQATRSPVTARPPSATTDFLATHVRAYCLSFFLCDLVVMMQNLIVQSRDIASFHIHGQTVFNTDRRELGPGRLLLWSHRTEHIASIHSSFPAGGA